MRRRADVSGLAIVGSFDSFNPYIIQGEVAAGVTYVTETLTSRSMDEIGGEYGLIAESVYHPDDHSLATFRLNPKARWHDGKPIVPDDFVFGFNFLKETHPQYAFYYKNVIKAEQTGDREVTFVFDSKGNRELPGIMGQLHAMPKHYWEGTDANGRKRDISKSTIEPLLGSGPYRVKDFKAGQSVTYERVKDYWGADLPVNIGINNFDQIDFIYFRDRTIVFEAFKGDQVDVRPGGGTKEWETQYDFPRVQEGPDHQGVLHHQRRRAYAGLRLQYTAREFRTGGCAMRFNLAYDFEGRMRLLSFGDHNKRTQSYFENSELPRTACRKAASSRSSPSSRIKIPDEVFTTEYVNPVNGTPQNIRENLHEAVALLKDAGWWIKNAA